MTNESNELKENQRICRIKEVMDNAESALYQFLEKQSIQSILDKANKDCHHHLPTD